MCIQFELQDDPSARRLGYVDTVPSQDNLQMRRNWCQHNLVRKQMGHPLPLGFLLSRFFHFSNLKISRNSRKPSVLVDNVSIPTFVLTLSHAKICPANVLHMSWKCPCQVFVQNMTLRPNFCPKHVQYLSLASTFVQYLSPELYKFSSKNCRTKSGQRLTLMSDAWKI